MADKWNGIWSGTVEGRPVIVEKYDESDDLRARTAPKEEDPRTLRQQGGSGASLASFWKEDPIKVDGPTKADLGINLIGDGGFTPDGAAEIVSHIP